MAASGRGVPILPEAIPPSPDSPRAQGLGLDGVPAMAIAHIDSDQSLLSPSRAHFPPSVLGKTPSTNSTPSTGTTTAPGTGASQQDGKGPFNFQPMTLTKSPISQSGVGQRRGHKYKHSSVSHSIFLEPPPRAPISLPSSLPIPTARELLRSRTPAQTTRLIWCLCHAAIALLTLTRATATGSLARTALSHLLAFDALGASVVAVVDVMANFEAWRRPSVRRPFGLARAEVLAGVALSIMLLFMGLDLVSHVLQHALEGAGSHTPHVDHHHAEATASPLDTPGQVTIAVDLVAVLALTATLISALALDNHLRIGRALRLTLFRSLPSILRNPAHCLTLCCAATLLVLPLVAVPVVGVLDQLLASAVAGAMIALGSRLVHRLGCMLLMACPQNPSPPTDIAPTPAAPAAARDVELLPAQKLAAIVGALEAEPLVAAVDALRVWQVHYGLCMAGVELRTRAGARDEDRLRLRDRVAGLVRGRLAGGYGSGDGGGSMKWEISTQMTPEE